MKVYYRVSPFLSSNTNPLGRDKFFIIKTCWESFKKALTGQEVFIINDSLPDEYLELFKGQNIIDASGKKNVGTFHTQLNLIANLPNEEKVMLVEDDYLWIPESLGKIERALDEINIVSPYDHPGHYVEERFKHTPKRMILIDNQTYREAPSNTLTFATYAWVIKQNLELIKSFGIRDHSIFTALDHDLFVPVPSLATHLVEGLLAPNVEWNICKLKS